VLWVADGSLLGGELDGVEQLDLVHLVTETLRQRRGTFVFEVVPVDGGRAHGAVPAALCDVLPEAGLRLEQWAAVEAVIPTVSHRLRLSSALPVESVTLDRVRWALVASAAHRPDVREAATELGMDELSAGQLASEMVALGLLVVEDPATGDAAVEGRTAGTASAGPVPGAVPPGQWEPEDDVHELGLGTASWDAPVHGADAAAGHFPIDDLIGSGPDDDWGHMAEPAPPVAPDPFAAPASPEEASPAGPAPVVHDGPVFAGLPDADETLPAGSGGRHHLGAGPVDGVELQRQLADLSPRAAEAIAAALEALPDDPTA